MSNLNGWRHKKSAAHHYITTSVLKIPLTEALKSRLEAPSLASGTGRA